MIKANKQTDGSGLPVLSIVVVVYNAGQTLEQTLLSVVKQTYQNIQLIVIDGGSTDNTVDIIKRYEDSIFYWVSEPDKGIYDAMNKAVGIASGDWIYFLGSGDLLINIIDKVIPKLIDNHTIYYGNVYRNDLMCVYRGKFTPFRLSRLSICHQAILYPLAAVKKYKFDTKYRVQADHHLNMLLYGDKDYKFKYIDVIVALYDGAGFSDVNRDIPFFRDRLQIVKANFPFVVYLYAYMRSVVAKLLNRDYLEENKSE